MTHHLTDVSHTHKWKPFVLSDEEGPYYMGHICTECGEQGYAVPGENRASIEEWIAHLDEEHEDDERR